jgi:hypothetical protein
LAPTRKRKPAGIKQLGRLNIQFGTGKRKYGNRFLASTAPPYMVAPMATVFNWFAILAELSESWLDGAIQKARVFFFYITVI